MDHKLVPSGDVMRHNPSNIHTLGGARYTEASCRIGKRLGRTHGVDVVLGQTHSRCIFKLAEMGARPLL